MKKIIIKRKSLAKLCTLCSLDLIDYVFNAFKTCGGEIFIDETNQKHDVWELEDFHNSQTIDKLEIMKVMSSFGQFGMFIINGKTLFFEGVVLNETNNEGTLVNKMWFHCNHNGITPFFQLGKIEIPPLMPKFVCVKMADSVYQIEKLERGEYVLMPELYPTKEMCENRCKELNQDDSDMILPH